MKLYLSDVTYVLTRQCNVNTQSWAYRRYTDLGGKQDIKAILRTWLDRNAWDSEEITPHLLSYRINI